MTYDKLEKKKRAAAKRKEDLELECKLYCESDSWEEFELKRTAARIKCNCRPFDMFRRHYVMMDEGALMCFLRYDWPSIAIPILADVIVLTVSGSFIAFFMTFMFTAVTTMLYHVAILSETERHYFRKIDEYIDIHSKHRDGKTVHSPPILSVGYPLT